MTFSQSFGDQIHDELVLLAPAWSHIPESFTRRCVDRDKHARWLSAAQRVRGGVYLADGAVQASDLTADGRHVQPSDYASWHLLAVAANGDVQGCARYRHLTGKVGFDDLMVRESSLARCEQWGPSLRAAVEAEIVQALHSPVPALSLDGLKRRTRAQMGRCQGGFCGPRLMEIICRETGGSMDDITKSGGGSSRAPDNPARSASFTTCLNGSFSRAMRRRIRCSTSGSMVRVVLITTSYGHSKMMSRHQGRRQPNSRPALILVRFRVFPIELQVLQALAPSLASSRLPPAL